MSDFDNDEIDLSYRGAKPLNTKWFVTQERFDEIFSKLKFSGKRGDGGITLEPGYRPADRVPGKRKYLTDEEYAKRMK